MSGYVYVSLVPLSVEPGAGLVTVTEPLLLDLYLVSVIAVLVGYPWLFYESIVYPLTGAVILGLFLSSVHLTRYWFSPIIVPLISLVSGLAGYARLSRTGYWVTVRGIDYPVLFSRGLGNPSPATIIWTDTIIVPEDLPLFDNSELIGVLGHEEGHIKQKYIIIMYLLLLSCWLFRSNTAPSYIEIMLSVPLLNWFREITADLHSGKKTGYRFHSSVYRLLEISVTQRLIVKLSALLTHPPPRLRLHYIERFLTYSSST